MKRNSLAKIVLFVFFCFMSNYTAKAQIEGDRIVNLGIGIGNYFGGINYYTTVPPVSGSFEYILKNELFDEYSTLGIGGYMAYMANKQKFYDDHEEYGWNYSHFVLGARGVLHYRFIEKVDTYGGLMLGYNIASASAFGGRSNINKSSVSGILSTIFVGARYHFSDNIAAFAELGYGVSALELGISFKF
jgi:hypothetical protein